jgi:glutamate-5-semialdehyde dehydrogenase
MTDKNLLQNFKNTKKAGFELLKINDKQRNAVLLDLANNLEKNINKIISENQKDLDKMSSEDPKYDRLKLTSERIKSISESIRSVANLASPLNKIFDKKTLENGLNIKKITVPLGVIGVIYEARPNVTPDVFTLAFKSGNACILKGGSDADFSNKILVKIIQDILKKHNLDHSLIYLMPPEREFVKDLLKATDFVDVIIPRGSQNLIDFVRDNSKVPVIETGAGVCHVYFDKEGKIDYAKDIILNAKTRRPSVCNSLDCLILHSDRIKDLDEITRPLILHQVEIFADERAYQILKNSYPKDLLQKAEDEHFGKEFLSLKMAIKTIDSFEEALSHIQNFSSGHSEAIITENKTKAEDFLNLVDASSVYLNTSIAFTDGGEFGLGCEIGISTQKLHARGPMGLEELTSYKWIIESEGVVRENKTKQLSSVCSRSS